MSVLNVENLDIGYVGRSVGRSISFTLAAGQVMCLLGPNGSGKTTLFKTLLGLLPRQGGRIAVEGEAIGRWSRNRFARIMAYVPQSTPPSFAYTVLQTVVMGRAAHMGLFAHPSGTDMDIALSCLDTLGIGHLAHRALPDLSGGERQLALIARALAQQPRILVMDEPTANLDFGNRLKVLEQVRRLAAGDMAVILSTHDPDHAFQIADLVTLLHQGRQLALGTPEAVITSEMLSKVYGVTAEVVAVRRGSQQHRVCLPAVPPAANQREHI